MSITLDLPPGIEDSLIAAWGEADAGLRRQILEAVAAEGYRQGALTRLEVGQFLGLDFWDTQAFLRERGAGTQYALEDFEDDRRTIAEMFPKRKLDERAAAPRPS